MFNELRKQQYLLNRDLQKKSFKCLLIKELEEQKYVAETLPDEKMLFGHRDIKFFFIQKCVTLLAITY